MCCDGKAESWRKATACHDQTKTKPPFSLPGLTVSRPARFHLHNHLLGSQNCNTEQVPVGPVGHQIEIRAQAHLRDLQPESVDSCHQAPNRTVYGDPKHSPSGRMAFQPRLPRQSPAPSLHRSERDSSCHNYSHLLPYPEWRPKGRGGKVSSDWSSP